MVQYLSFVENEIRAGSISSRMDLGWLVFSDGFYFGAFDRFLKRSFDLGVSLIMLILTAPLLLMGVLAIRLDSPGLGFLPARTRDVGWDGFSDSEIADDAGRC